MSLSKHIAPVTVLVCLILVIAVPVYGKGGPTSAPGQVKKQQVTVGNVSRVTGSSLVLTDNSQTTVDSSTKLVGQAKKNLRLSQIGQGDLVAVFTSGTGTGSAKGKADKVFVRSASVSAEISKRDAVMGLIVNISGNVITVAHQIHRDRTWTVIMSSQTVIKGASGSAALSVGERIVAVGQSSPTGLLARWIHVIPGKATGIFKKQPAPTGTTIATPAATPSATPTATPSATPTGTPSATPTI